MWNSMLRERNMARFRPIIKRLIDVVVSATILILTIPVILCIGLLICCKMGYPILFRQHRPGLNGRPFTFFKFRTMLDLFTDDGTILPDSVRLTSTGKFLRRWSLDELPQLWNVLRGDMSLVGPRPLLMEYLDLYTSEQTRRHDVKPGITGWAQIHGRNAITWEEKFNLDLWYVDNWSLWLDFRILGFTFWKVLRGEGISAAGHCSMPKFLGSNNTRRDAA